MSPTGWDRIIHVNVVTIQNGGFTHVRHCSPRRMSRPSVTGSNVSNPSVIDNGAIPGSSEMANVRQSGSLPATVPTSRQALPDAVSRDWYHCGFRTSSDRVGSPCNPRRRLRGRARRWHRVDGSHAGGSAKKKERSTQGPPLLSVLRFYRNVNCTPVKRKRPK
jgi:hypothetical protein